MPICKLFGVQLHILDIVLLNECGFVTDAERSITCSKTSVFDLTESVLLLTQAVPRIYPNAPLLSQAFGA